MTSVTTLSGVPEATAASTAAPVARTSSGAQAQNAAALAGDSAVVSLLGGGSGALTYDAAGLFNAFAQAGTSAAGGATGTESLDQQILNALAPANAGPTGLDALAATVSTAGIDQNASYAAILQQDPGAAAKLITESTEQGIIGTISTYA
jgi:hypothetical protein